MSDPWEVLPRRVRARMPRVGDGVTERINLLDAMAELAAVSMARARFLGELLEEQFAYAQERAENPDASLREQDGGVAAGLVGHTYDSAVLGHGENAVFERIATAEQVRALVTLEAQERDRAAKLIHDCLKMGVSLQQIEVIRSYAGTIAAALQSLVGELGLSLEDGAILRAAQRAGLSARRQLGHDDGDPDVHIGPALSPSERVTALRAALDRAEAELERTSVEGR